MACICLAQTEDHWNDVVNMPWLFGYHKKPCCPLSGVKDMAKFHFPLAVKEFRLFGRPVGVLNNAVSTHFRLATSEEFQLAVFYQSIRRHTTRRKF
jgi:hypothetical protein